MANELAVERTADRDVDRWRRLADTSYRLRWRVGGAVIALDVIAAASACSALFGGGVSPGDALRVVLVALVVDVAARVFCPPALATPTADRLVAERVLQRDVESSGEPEGSRSI